MPPFLYKRSIDVKSALTFEKGPLVAAAEQKLKMSKSYQIPFSISPLPPEGAFQVSFHFSHLWTIAKKSGTQIFDMLYINRFNFMHSSTLNYRMSWFFDNSLLHIFWCLVIFGIFLAFENNFNSREIIWKFGFRKWYKRTDKWSRINDLCEIAYGARKWQNSCTTFISFLKCSIPVLIIN